MNFEEYKKCLKDASTEEMVKASYAEYFGIRYDTKNKHDLYTPNVLFEFKYDKNIQNLKTRATTLAQILYYTRRLKYHEITKTIPAFPCLANENDAIITETKDYDHFLKNYEYVTNPETISGIHAKLDRLTDESQRRFEGEFYTPLSFAQKSIHYLTKVLGKNWYKSDKFRIWDMAAGTGNLEYHLPAQSYKYLYLSTLHAGEADHLKKIFPEATCFQYDYLNDDVDYLFSKGELPFEPEWKMPQKLRDELNDPEITWVVFINPPFATSQDARGGGRSKKGVSKTKIDRLMNKYCTGHAKREL
ncbi:MAG: hypothetical protein LBC20_03100, partial [Planctomycetaceae bacterium]|nr:hypothetical protein [Planctomycetaceae bacterium]